MLLASLAIILFALMLVEARRARRNERTQMTRGGIEPPDDVHGVMRWAYPAAFAVMIGEGAMRGAPPASVFVVGAGVFAFAKALKWWAIVSLGSCWTFRVVVVPGAPLVRRGPYRLLRHPNYLGVLGELAGAALMTGAMVSGPIAILGFGGLMLKRIGVEERALGAMLARK